MYSIKGVIKSISETQVISDKFQKREFVIETQDEKYPQLIQLQLAQDKTGLIDSYAEGEEATVYFNLRGREWTSPKDGSIKYFNTLDAWKIEKAAATTTATVSTVNEEEDLPF